MLKDGIVLKKSGKNPLSRYVYSNRRNAGYRDTLIQIICGEVYSTLNVRYIGGTTRYWSYTDGTYSEMFRMPDGKYFVLLSRCDCKSYSRLSLIEPYTPEDAIETLYWWMSKEGKYDYDLLNELKELDGLEGLEF